VKHYIGMDIVETENIPEVVQYLDNAGIHYDSGGEVLQVRTKNPKDITDKLRESFQGIRIITRPGSLEDVFLLLTGRRLRD